MAQICTCVQPQCGSCLQVVASYCPTVINVDAHIVVPSPDSLYLWVVDKLGNVFMDPVTINHDGSFDITISNYPAGSFNQYSGDYYVYVTSDPEGNILVEMHASSPAVTCVIVSVSPPVFFVEENLCTYFCSENEQGYFIKE